VRVHERHPFNSLGGRAPPGRNTPTLSAGSHSRASDPDSLRSSSSLSRRRSSVPTPVGPWLHPLNEWAPGKPGAVHSYPSSAGDACAKHVLGHDWSPNTAHNCPSRGLAARRDHRSSSSFSGIQSGMGCCSAASACSGLFVISRSSVQSRAPAPVFQRVAERGFQL
jgi:hypothetical protein